MFIWWTSPDLNNAWGATQMIGMGAGAATKSKSRCRWMERTSPDSRWMSSLLKCLNSFQHTQHHHLSQLAQSSSTPPVWFAKLTWKVCFSAGFQLIFPCRPLSLEPGSMIHSFCLIRTRSDLCDMDRVVFFADWGLNCAMPRETTAV